MGFEEDFDEDLEEPKEKTPMKSKTPVATPIVGGKRFNLFFLSTIGPGEKRQKLLVDDGNSVGAIKQTIGNIFGLDPADFHLSSGGVTMDENSPLNAYNLSDGDEVLLIPASTAG